MNCEVEYYIREKPGRSYELTVTGLTGEQISKVLTTFRLSIAGRGKLKGTVSTYAMAVDLARHIRQLLAEGEE